MKKKIGVFAALFLALAALGSAQSYTLTDADSNLTNAQLTADFSGLPADTELRLNAVGQNSTLPTFTTSSAGSATLEWTHNPFEAGQIELGTDGWRYELIDTSDSSTVYSFQVAHGNMLSGLDTFDDGSLNTNIWSSVGSTEVYSEENGYLEYSGSNSGVTRLNYTDSIESNEALIINWSGNGNGGGIRLRNPEGDNVLLISPTSDLSNYKTQKIYYDENSQEIIAESGGTIVASASMTSYDQFHAHVRAYNADATNRIEDVTQVPRISLDAFTGNTFDVEEQVSFSEFQVNQEGTSGLEFSNESMDWSVTPPTGGEELNYRNVQDGTLNAVAVDTGRLLGGLEFNPIRPENNTAFVVQDGDTLNQQFSWEFTYSRQDCSENAQIVTGWTLFNQSSGNQIDQSIFTDASMPAGQCNFYQDYQENADLPPGDYRWRTQFNEGNIGVTRFYNMEFSVVSENNAPVSFNLIDPMEGETVELDNGSTAFDYNAELANSGTLQLLLPQLEDSVKYSTSVEAGNYSTSITVGNLTSGFTYDWQLRFVDDSSGNTFLSDRVSFTTTGEEADGGDGENGTDGDDGDGDTEPTIDVEQAYFDFMDNRFGFNETTAGYILAVILAVGLATILASVAATMDLGGVTLPAIGFLTGIVLSSLMGYLPGWVTFMLAVLSAAIVAKIGGGALNE